MQERPVGGAPDKISVKRDCMHIGYDSQQQCAHQQGIRQPTEKPALKHQVYVI